MPEETKAKFAAVSPAPKAEPFPLCEEGVPLPLWRYFRVRHSIAGYDAAGEYRKAVETFKADGRWVSVDGGVVVGPKKMKEQPKA